MSTNKIRAGFVGCSQTFGEGFPEELRDQYIYDRLVARHFGFDNVNLGQPGASNYNIFMQAGNALHSKQFDILFVQWSGVNRMWLSPGPGAHLHLNDKKYLDFRYRDLYVASTELSKFKQLALLLNHDYQNILDLIDYCKFIELMASQTQTKIVHINGLLYWKNDLCTPLTNDLVNDLSPYSKELLDFNNRDDEEIIMYFTKLQEKFADLDQSKWVNLFNPFIDNIVDQGPEGHHPGIQSHQWMADQIIKHLTERKII